MDIQGFLASLENRGCSPETLRAYRTDLKLFESFLRAKKLRTTQVKPKLIEEFCRSMGDVGDVAPATRGRRLAALSSYYQFLRANSNDQIKNPVALIRRPRLGPSTPKAIGQDAFAALLGVIDNPRDRALLMLFVASGLRLSEVFQLNRDSISVEQETLPTGDMRILGTGQVLGKGKKERVFLVDHPTLEALAVYLAQRSDNNVALFVSSRAQRLSRRSMEDILHRWCRRAGLKPLRIHALRHEYATRMANAGMPSIVLKELMGHNSFSTTQRYFRINRARMAQEYHAAMQLASPPSF